MSSTCPDCGSLSTISGTWNSSVEGGSEFNYATLTPGERCPYLCSECGATFIAVVPEPRDPYLGDGVFASNH